MQQLVQFETQHVANLPYAPVFNDSIGANHAPETVEQAHELWEAHPPCIATRAWRGQSPHSACIVRRLLTDPCATPVSVFGPWSAKGVYADSGLAL